VRERGREVGDLMAFGREVEGAAAKTPEEDLDRLGFRWRCPPVGLGGPVVGLSTWPHGLVGWGVSPLFFYKTVFFILLLFVFKSFLNRF
jgi:hypothetical protein